MLSLLRFREVDTADFLKHNNNSQRRGEGLVVKFFRHVLISMFLVAGSYLKITTRE